MPGTRWPALAKPVGPNTTATGTVAPDLSLGSACFYTLTGNVTFNAPVNPVGFGQEMLISLTQDATGARTVTFSGSYVGPIPAPNAAAGSNTVYTFLNIGQNVWWCTGCVQIVAGGGGGPPTGAAGGDLSGTYPNPVVEKASDSAGFTVVGNLFGDAIVFANVSTASQIAEGYDGITAALAAAISFGSAADAVIARSAAGVLVAKGGTNVSGLSQGPWVSKSAAYTMSNVDAGVVLTATATVTLPASPFANFRYGVKIIGGGVTATVSTGSAAKIDSGGPTNATSITFSANGQSMDFQLAPNGTDWLLV